MTSRLLLPSAVCALGAALSLASLGCAGSDTNVVPFQSVSSQSTTNLRNIALTGFTQGPQFFGSVPGTTLLTNFSFTP